MVSSRAYNNRTVLHLLEALQVLQVRLPGGGPAEPRKLSFRSLDIEQIGHVYEGLLDHTAIRATEPVLGLAGTRDHEPEVPLSKLEELAEKDEKELHKFLKKETGRSSVATIKRILNAEVDDQAANRFRTACHGNEELWKRIEPFAGLVRTDTFGYPAVIVTKSVYVTAGTDRRSSGTHYTPKSLTEPIVQYTLEPLVYEGPAEGKPKSEWKLKTAAELLDLNICDMACGSGAFLVQACRYMSDRLVEAWEAVEKQVEGTPKITPLGEVSEGSPTEQIIPADTEERLAYARRIVAQRCLYGVDVNPLAAEMAKLSLWLLTLAKDKPFEFLDHAIRCGDSLVGIHDIEQLKHFSLKPDNSSTPLFKGPLDQAVSEAIELRLKLEDMPSNTVEEVEAQEKLLAEAEDKIARLRCAADLLVSAEFWADNAKDKQEKVGSAGVLAERYVEQGSAEEFEEKATKERKGQRMFHWPLEFPEVIVKRGGFDAIAGNPPFLGGTRIKGALGKSYLGYLVSDFGSGNRADLCTYFLHRAYALTHRHGHFGFITTNSISQGDSREFGLDFFPKHDCSIVRAIESRRWPGTASLEIAQVWLCRSKWSGDFHLADKKVTGITTFLTSSEDFAGTPKRLDLNRRFSFNGSKIYGQGFVLSPEHAEQLIERDIRNREVLFPYMRGEDLNTSPTQSCTSWVINFWDWPLNRSSAPTGYEGPVAEDYPDCLEIVEKLVKPERTRRKDNGEYALRKPLPQRWWIYGDHRPGLYAAIARLERVLLTAQVSPSMAVEFAPTGTVYNHKLIVFPFDDWSSFALMQSSFHWLWAQQYTSTLGATTLNYSSTDCFDTFPFPSVEANAQTGERYHQQRSAVMVARGIGLTALYNAVHDSSDCSKDIQELRDLQIETDQAVADAYDWADLVLGHGFHNTKRGVRFTVSEDARRELLQRLLKLNHERYEEEVIQGLHDKKKKRAKKKSTPRKRTKKKVSSGPSLFDKDDTEDG